jgi:hypothetical protein
LCNTSLGNIATKVQDLIGECHTVLGHLKLNKLFPAMTIYNTLALLGTGLLSPIGCVNNSSTVDNGSNVSTNTGNGGSI